MSGINERSALSIAQRQFDATADAIGLDDSLRAVLREVKRELRGMGGKAWRQVIKDYVAFWRGVSVEP